MKKIVGIDVSATSIGWAFIEEAESNDEVSSIINTGVRVVPLTSAEQTDFKKGNPISTNSQRTLRRGVRRNWQRFKLRRKALLCIFQKIKFISDDFVYAETGRWSTFSSYELRARAASERISRENLVRVLLMLNKKRGYNTNRRAVISSQNFLTTEPARDHTISPSNPPKEDYNAMESEQAVTRFYDSDLQNELDAIVGFQKQFYPQYINSEVSEAIRGKSKALTIQYFRDNNTIDLEQWGTAVQRPQAQFHKWRKEALLAQLDLKKVVYVITEINHQIHQSGIYLNSIDSRSKELYLNKETVGQFLLRKLADNPHKKLKNQIFHRQDYRNEFDLIWATQARFYPELDEGLKKEVGEKTIFYQRKLRSKKQIISQCDLEKGHKVIPKSSPLHQEFQVWKALNVIAVHNVTDKDSVSLSQALRDQLAGELLFKEGYCEKQLTKFYRHASGNPGIITRKIAGNKTNCAINSAFMQILSLEGYDLTELLQSSASEYTSLVRTAFLQLGINTGLLEFDPGLTGNDFDKQPYYQLWHLLYSAEEENALKKSLVRRFGFSDSHAALLLDVKLQQGYGTLSAKAIKKILPYLKQGFRYDQARILAGYVAAGSEASSKENAGDLNQKIEEIKMGEVRNPVIVKVLNQLIHIINAICTNPLMGKPDEIRIAISGELNNSSEKRAQFSRHLARNRTEYNRIKKILNEDFALGIVTRNDITRYKLWQECGGISLYTGKAIEESQLFTDRYAVGSIIAEKHLFDDRFSNKIIAEEHLIREQADQTTYSFLKENLSALEFEQFHQRAGTLSGSSSAEKCRKLLLYNSEIPEDFMDRHIMADRYMTSRIEKKLSVVCPAITFSTRSVTDKLRRDWDLVDVMKEINWERYDSLGLTQKEKGSSGAILTKINHWTQLSDYRYDALNAILSAFSHMHYTESLKKLHWEGQKNNGESGFSVMDPKYMLREKGGTVYFEPPMEDFKTRVIDRLESVLVSYKTKNKVVASTRNHLRTRHGIQTKIQFNPRGPLHKETLYGAVSRYAVKEMKVNVNFTEQTISKVAKKPYRDILLKRLLENDNDAKKAFTGKNAVSRNPLYLDAEKNKPLPQEVKLVWLDPHYSIRKAITPDLKIDKVIDQGIKSLLIERLNEYGGDPQKAFANLEENPLWQNREKGICIRSVALLGVSNTKALHLKRDHLGSTILDENGNSIPNDFISTGNNHHLALYRDSLGNLHDEVISFYDTVLRSTEGSPPVKTKHENGWSLVTTIRQNELFVFPGEGFNPRQIDLYDPKNRKIISEHLFRAQKISKVENAPGCIRGYLFRHHLESEIKDIKILKDKTYKMIRSLSAFKGIVKIRLDHLGQVVHVGEALE